MGISAGSKNSLRKKPAIFLDRDGTIIHHVDLITEVSKMRLLPGAAKALREFKKLGFLIIVITNQPTVARGMIEPEGVEYMHKVLAERLLKLGVRIDAFYFCPHHPDANVKKYRVKCDCRKPEPGLILKGIKEFNIDVKKSFMIGDAMMDVVSGKRAGLKTVLVETGPGHTSDKLYKNVKPDFMAKNLMAAARFIEKFEK